MANYNVDLLIQVAKDKAAADIDKVKGKLDSLQKNARINLTVQDKGFRGIKSKAKEISDTIRGIAERGSFVLGAGLWGNVSNAIAGLKAPIEQLNGPLNFVKSSMSSLIETAVRGLPATGDAIYVAGKQFDQFSQWFSTLDPQMQLFAAGIAAISPQIFKLTRGFLKQKTSLFSVTDGFKKLDQAGKRASGSLINGMTGVQAAINKAAEAQLKFDNSLRGASLTQLNQITRQARSELEGYWSMTGKAEKAANNYVKALRAQKQEQEAINRLVKEAKGRQGLSKEEQQEAVVSLAAQKEKALLERKERIKEISHQKLRLKIRRMDRKEEKAREAERNRNRQKERLREGLMLGVGFPLLFGGGPGSILGGGAGALLQSQLGKGENKGKGFGAQIALSAVGGQIDRLVAQIVGGLVAVGKAVTTTANAYEYLEEKSLFSTKQIKERAEALKEQGEVEKLNTLLTEEYVRLVGREGFKDLQRAGDKANELSIAWDELSLAMSGLLAGPLGDMIELLTTVANYHTDKARLKLLQKDLRAQGIPESKKLDAEIKALEYPLMLGTFAKKMPLSGENTRDLLKRYSGFRNTDGMEFGESGDLGKRAKLTDSQKIAAERERLELVFKHGEREAAILTQINKLLDDKDGKKAASLRKDMEAINQLKDMNEIYKGIGQTIKDGLVEGINAAIDGTKTLGEIASNVFRQISNQLISYGINASLGSIPGLEKIFGRASGGPVKGGSPYIVGEKGPELFVPGSSGNIVPNHAMGGTNVVVNVDASGSSVQGDGGQAEELGGMLAAAVQAEIANQQRPGGLLAGTR